MILHFTVLGVPISVHWTVIILILLFMADSYAYIKGKLGNRNTTFIYLIATLVSAILILLSIAIHETSHALVGHALGYTITQAGINGAFAYVANGIDFATIPPYKEFLIALAGPAANFVLALIAVPFIYLLGKSLPGIALRYFAILNIKLGRINLWPLAFLDGGKMLDAVIRATIGQYSWSIYITYVIWALFIAYIFSKKKGHFELEQLIDRIPA